MSAEKSDTAAGADKPVLREYTADEVKQHKSEKDVWLIIHGKVYDVTPFLEDHPGGPEILHNVAGQECTTNFEEVFHSPKARNMVDKYLVGRLAGYTGPEDAIKGKAKGAKGGADAPAGMNSGLVAVVIIVLLALLYQAFGAN